MKYKVESIGAAFSTKDMTGLGARFDKKSTDGWELHLVFPVEKTGCFGRGETTYLAVYKKDE